MLREGIYYGADDLSLSAGKSDNDSGTDEDVLDVDMAGTDPLIEEMPDVDQEIPPEIKAEMEAEDMAAKYEKLKTYGVSVGDRFSKTEKRFDRYEDRWSVALRKFIPTKVMITHRTDTVIKGITDGGALIALEETGFASTGIQKGKEVSFYSDFESRSLYFQNPNEFRQYLASHSLEKD